jgi:hypothetical protein
MPKFVRFKGGVILRHPETGAPFVPGSDPVDETDPIVKANRWAFASDGELAEERAAARNVDSVTIEKATRAPGEKRSTKRS